MTPSARLRFTAGRRSPRLSRLQRTGDWPMETNAMSVAPDLPDDGLLVGWSLEHEHARVPVGFRIGGGDSVKVPPRHLDPILFTAEGHLITIAPTGAGKGIGVTVPTLLRYPGSVIVVDPKGEAYAVTARRRHDMGQQVVLIDPFHVVEAGEEKRGGLNPLDLIDPAAPIGIDDAAALATMLVPVQNQRDPFWDLSAREMCTGLLMHVRANAPKPLSTLAEVHYLVTQSKRDFDITLLEMSKAKQPAVRRTAGTLSGHEPKVMASIISTAQAHLGFLRGPLTQESLCRTSFDPQALIDGAPMTLYLVLPPDKLESHGRLLRLWIGTLMAWLLRRRRVPEHKTLFLIDEAAQLGTMEQFRQAVTLLRGYGLQTWSLWQDLSQIRNLYPQDWQTIFNNCKVFQAFGCNTLAAATAVAEACGYPEPMDLLNLDADEMLLMIGGDEPVIAQRPNYLADAPFRGRFDANPFHAADDLDAVTPRSPQRSFVRRSRAQIDHDLRRVLEQARERVRERHAGEEAAAAERLLGMIGELEGELFPAAQP